MKNFDEERLREEYTIKPKPKIAEALRLDRKAKTPAYVFTFTYGIIGTLLLGLGMCFCMDVLGDGSMLFMVLGVIIGVLGIAIISSNYPIFSKILRARKEKYASAILIALNKEEE